MKLARTWALVTILMSLLHAAAVGSARAQDLPAYTPFSLGSPVRGGYGAYTIQYVQVYGARPSKPAPVVVFFSNRAPSQPCAVEPFANQLNRAGALVALVSTRVTLFAQSAQDIPRAFRFLKKNARRFNLDLSRIVVVGCGTGATLAALVATDPTYMQGAGLNFSALKGAAILNGPVFDLAGEMDTLAVNDQRSFRELSDLWGDDRAVWERLSPTSHLAAPNAPSFFVTGPTEAPGSDTRWLDFVKRLKSAGQADVLAYRIGEARAGSNPRSQPDSLDWPELLSFIVFRLGRDVSQPN